jgi:Zn-dependent metalloprotease
MCKNHINPLYCIIPPDVFEHLAQSNDPTLRKIGIDNIEAAAVTRTTRMLTPADLVSAIATRSLGKHREVYDLQRQPQFALPGKLVRKEGDAPVADVSVNEAYDFAGSTYDFYKQLFNRNSLDDNGLPLISSVHLAENNAFWNGRQMAYGDGDGMLFNRFTCSLDVVGHEFTHGVVSFTSRLVYRDEPGAINEHLADVFGTLIKQWAGNQDAHAASWLVGEEIIIPAPTRRAVRDMKNPGKAYVGDLLMGTDRQVDHISKKYTGPKDSGGVHWNSGIPNKAFCHAALKIGGQTWKTLGEVWYETMLQLSPTSGFQDLVRINLTIAQSKFGTADARYQAIKSGWQLVGL